MAIETLINTSKTTTKKHGNWIVILHNDNHNPFQRVIMLLVGIIGMSHQEAAMATKTAHQNGNAVVYTGPKERAEAYRESLEANGLTATIETI